MLNHDVLCHEIQEPLRFRRINTFIESINQKDEVMPAVTCTEELLEEFLPARYVKLLIFPSVGDALLISRYFCESMIW